MGHHLAGVHPGPKNMELSVMAWGDQKVQCWALAAECDDIWDILGPRSWSTETDVSAGLKAPDRKKVGFRCKMWPRLTKYVVGLVLSFWAIAMGHGHQEETQMTMLYYSVVAKDRRGEFHVSSLYNKDLCFKMFSEQNWMMRKSWNQKIHENVYENPKKPRGKNHGLTCR